MSTLTHISDAELDAVSGGFLNLFNFQAASITQVGVNRSTTIAAVSVPIASGTVQQNVQSAGVTQIN